MPMNEVINLITYAETQDDLKQTVRTPQYRQVFAEEGDPFGEEFARAGQIGIKPRKVFKIWALEYEGEKDLQHYDATYSIYRTYENKKTGKTELYCEVRIGGN